jgi:hypothetical protein
MRRIAFLLGAVATMASIIVFAARAFGHPDEAASPAASPIYGVTIPAGYRDWKMIAAAQLLVPGKTDQLRAQFVVGSPVNVQFMVKDSKKYAATGGWGFADFKDGKPGDKALHQTCFPCHTPAKDRDYVFTHYAP